MGAPPVGTPPVGAPPVGATTGVATTGGISAASAALYLLVYSTVESSG